MLASERFFVAFKKAGMLVAVAWTPSAAAGGGAEKNADVRFLAPGQEVFSGEMLSTDYTIKYPATQLTGLRRAEVLSIAGSDYKVREGPKSFHDGSVLEAKLEKL